MSVLSLVGLIALCLYSVPEVEEPKPIPCLVGTPIVEEVKTIEYDDVDITEIMIDRAYAALELLEENKEDELSFFRAYKLVLETYEDYIDPPETVYDYYTEDEIYLIQRMVETECYQQKFMSKVDVAHVALNRLEHEKFGDTAQEVIKPGQFVFTRTKISEETVLAVEYAFMFGSNFEGALYFHSNSKSDRFSGCDYIGTDEAGHHFYGVKGDN